MINTNSYTFFTRTGFVPGFKADPMFRCWADDDDSVDPTDDEMRDSMYVDEDSRPCDEDIW